MTVIPNADNIMHRYDSTIKHCLPRHRYEKLQLWSLPDSRCLAPVRAPKVDVSVAYHLWFAMTIAGLPRNQCLKMANQCLSLSIKSVQLSLTISLQNFGLLDPTLLQQLQVPACLQLSWTIMSNCEASLNINQMCQPLMINHGSPVNGQQTSSAGHQWLTKLLNLLVIIWIGLVLWLRISMVQLIK